MSLHQLSVLVTPTEEIVTLNGEDCRIWRGVTDSGHELYLCVQGVIVEKGPASQEIEQHLQAMPVHLVTTPQRRGGGA